MPEWKDDIKRGFRFLPHQVEFGPITEDSFRRYDVVVPLSLPALEEARRHSSHQKPRLPLPAAESVLVCDDKYELNQALVKAGFGPYIPKMAQGLALTPPYILKRRIGEWGNGCYIIRSRDDEEAQLDRITNPQYFCQEFIPGSTEFATRILVVKGRIVKALNIKYEFASDAPIKGQVAYLFKVIDRCPYLDLIRPGAANDRIRRALLCELQGPKGPALSAGDQSTLRRKPVIVFLFLRKTPVIARPHGNKDHHRQ
jgi:hypothetical protein